MATKVRRHSVAVMSTSYLPSPLSSSSPPPLTKKRPSLGNGMKTTEGLNSTEKKPTTTNTARTTDKGGEKAKPAFLLPSSSPAPPATMIRRHSVAVHPGEVVSVMAGDKIRKQVRNRSHSIPNQQPTSSDVIDELIEAADRALLRSTPLPRGSDYLQAAILEVDEDGS